VLLLAAAGTLCVAVREACAQQVTVSAPFHTLGDSFSERIGINWGFTTRGLSFQFGSPNMAAPPSGQPDITGALRTSFTFGRPGNGGFVNFSAGQGFRQTFTTQAPKVTVMNGQTGFVSDISLSPFVIGYIPVVGGFSTPAAVYPMMLPPAYPWVTPGVSGALGNPRVQAMREMIAQRNRAAADDLPDAPAAVAPPRPTAKAKAADQQPPNAPDNLPPAAMPPHDAAAEKVTAAQASSAGRAVPSVAEARRLHELERASEQQQAAVLYERARAAEEDGKPNVAKVYYQMVARRASGELKRQALARLAALGESTPP
jgi:hypothetical protein